MKKKIEKLKGTLSVEHLHHFRCGACDKWWSIGDPSIALPGKQSATKREWFCPWCGEKNIFGDGTEIKREF
ncbi:MAG: hypothetical protein V4524_02750 [Patescibacteria group bacterium]